MTVIAVDWSGAKRPKGIWFAAVRNGELVESRPVRSREDAVAAVIATEPPVFAGFDFSFGLPAWFARDHGCTTLADVWELAARNGATWLQPTPPFWKTKCELPPGKRLRRCEARTPPAKSVFQLVGAGMVGPGSVRGMPLLRGLRRSGFAIWPLDAPGVRTAVEIYPSVLRRHVDHNAANPDQRDAECSALAMWAGRESVAALQAATDPVIRLEGDIWTPYNRVTPCP